MGINGSKEEHSHLHDDTAIPSQRQRFRPMTEQPVVSRAPADQPYSDLLTDVALGENVVPTVFKWEHGGKQVYITGTFNNWEQQLPMHRSGNDFTYVHNLKKGKHAFKFIVDDEWRYAPDQPTIADVDGQINNFIDVSDFIPYTGDDAFFLKSKERKVADEEFRQNIPDLDDYTKEPPALPPHLRHIILNKPSPTIDPQSLPSPQYVSLNHLYCTAIKDGMMVLGATQRYKEKFFTIVFYSVMPPSGPQAQY